MLKREFSLGLIIVQLKKVPTGLKFSPSAVEKEFD
jgi:hypothetical protein